MFQTVQHDPTCLPMKPYETHVQQVSHIQASCPSPSSCTPSLFETTKSQQPQRIPVVRSPKKYRSLVRPKELRTFTCEAKVSRVARSTLARGERQRTNNKTQGGRVLKKKETWVLLGLAAWVLCCLAANYSWHLRCTNRRAAVKNAFCPSQCFPGRCDFMLLGQGSYAKRFSEHATLTLQLPSDQAEFVFIAMML